MKDRQTRDCRKHYCDIIRLQSSARKYVSAIITIHIKLSRGCLSSVCVRGGGFKYPTRIWGSESDVLSAKTCSNVSAEKSIISTPAIILSVLRHALGINISRFLLLPRPLRPFQIIPIVV